jgi:class 3 adenylate cyclase
MGKFIVRREDVIPNQGEGEHVGIIKKEVLDRFDPSVLGLGDISLKSTPVDAVAAIFDLQGFTRFCSQSDPQLIVPKFLDFFLKWLFDKLRETEIEKELAEGYKIYSRPPFFSKFLGDGILFLWNTESELEINNIVSGCQRVSMHYPGQFLFSVKGKFRYQPTALRCGIARGTIYSIGNGKDYIGPCINLASRLQKLSSLTFAFSRDGFEYETQMPTTRSERYCIKKIEVKGVGEKNVCILKDEYDKLPKNEKKKFLEPD